ncbi:FAD:protein FMN transferase [Methylobacter marinus]|uniref:FAD:protein FMN transferase n=1 Tax=Methylobacter marinus TaxID=34058 RepID=UPI00036EEEA6|nr:FAD:protein FMN transferase [Methylobacter marinus]
MKFINQQRGAWLCLLLVFLLSACGNKAEQQQEYPFTYSGLTEGTSFHIKVSRLPEPVLPEQLKNQIMEVLDQIDGQMSTYLKDSELSRFNQNTSIDWVPVSAPLFTVLKEAQRISHLTGGAFDVTVGPLVNLWGFGPDPMKFVAPDNVSIQERLNKTGHNHLSIKEDLSAIKKAIPELYVDLSAIAKGYAVDQVGLLLEKNGITDYMVEIGGEITVKGKNINGGPWRIAIEQPTAEKRTVGKVVAITDISMATSGDYRNFFEVDGVRFSHTIDPRSGRPITHMLASVTILSKTTMEADALATAIMVLGPDEGYTFAERNNIAAFFIIKAAEGFDKKSTPAFTRYTELKG